jgi:hypothetical protein
MKAKSPNKPLLPVPAARSSVKRGRPWISALVVLGLGLLVMLPLSYKALDYFMPIPPGQGQIAAARAGWYLNHAQWRADVRTLVSAIEFVMDWTPDTPAGANFPTNQLAAPSRPANTNPPSPSQVQDDDLGFLDFRS